MRRQVTLTWKPQCLFSCISLVFIVTGTPAGVEEPRDLIRKTRVPLTVSKNGEKLIAALATTNHAPTLFRSPGTDNRSIPIFPKDFDWKEYARVRAAIKDLEANSEIAWSSIVEHLTDSQYCFTVESYDSAHNDSRGHVCFRIAQSWLNRAYTGLMPMDRLLYQYQAPHNMNSEELQRWCSARRDKKLYEIQIEAAEWALSIIPKESKMPKEPQIHAVAEIQKRIKKLRESHKAIPGKYFITDVICPFAERDAEKYREIAR
jgi:hypothetical protein